MKDPAREARLFASIVERGIEEPLEGVEVEGRRIDQRQLDFPPDDN